MTKSEDMSERVELLRSLAERKGYQLRRADHDQTLWHLVNPHIDSKIYSFSFTSPHSFTLSEVSALLESKPDAVDR